MENGSSKKLAAALIVITLFVSHQTFLFIRSYKVSPGDTLTISISGSNLTFNRNKHLIYEAVGDYEVEDLYKALGWMHAKDRYVQLCLMRLASQGRLTEVFPYDTVNHKLDLLAKQFDFYGRGKTLYSEYSENGEASKILSAFTDGLNHVIERDSRPLEFIITGYYPEAFHPIDVISFTQFVSFAGLDEIGLSQEKLIVELARSDKVSLDLLKGLYAPHLNNMTDYHVELYKSVSQLKSADGARSPFIPVLTNSNNWVISGALSSTKFPIMSADPHLDLSKTPNTFYESVFRSRDGKNFIFGVSVPGIPSILMGRSDHVSFSLTYGMMDMADLFLERIEDGSYERDGVYIPLKSRNCQIAGETAIFYETEDGHVIERYNEEYNSEISDGIYVAIRLATRNDEETYRISKMAFATNVTEAQKLLPQSNLASNYLLADVEGNIGYQQAGMIPLRPASTGLLPLPAWDSANHWTGYLSDDDYRQDLNPPENFIATANNFIQDPNKPPVNSYAALPTRVQRISQLLQSKPIHSVEDMMAYQGDTFSIIANNTIPRLERFLPSSGIGNELRHWDRRFKADSRPSALWLRFWDEFTNTVGLRLLGEEAYARLAPVVFYKYTFYRLALLGLDTGHLDGHDISDITEESIARVIEQYNGEVYGDYRKVSSKNMFFGGKLPSFFGLDIEPIPTDGGFEVVKVMSQDKYLGETCFFTQTWRFVADMSSSTCYSVLPGGPGGSVFSNLYKREVDLYRDHLYKEIEL